MLGRLPVTFFILSLPPGRRTIAQLAKFYYHSASRTGPIRARNPVLREIGNNTDLTVYFEHDKRALALTVPEVESEAL